MPRPTAIVYVDGFNLYYGLLRDSPHKWLNLESLFDDLLPAYDVIEIRYFTARIKLAARPADPGAPGRQKAYLNALGSLMRVDVIEGSFMIHKTFARRRLRHRWQRLMVPKERQARWLVPIWKVEEKGSDVNLGSYLVLDASRSAADIHVVVTSDSDLAEPLRIATKELGAKVALCFPHGRHSKELAKCSYEFILWISDGALARAQFPDPVAHHGRTYYKPRSW